MKKNIAISCILIVFVMAFFFFKKDTSPLENKIALFNNFEASLDFTMNSLGEYKMGGAEGVLVKTDLLGKPVISFSKEENLMKVTWDPKVVLAVNGMIKNEYASEFASVIEESFYLHFSDRMIIDNLYFTPRANISPEVQELVLNFNKMLAHQLAWFFVLAPTEKISTVDGVDIWGENTQDISHSSEKITIITKSKERSDNSQKGHGSFDLQRLKDGGIVVAGSQESIFGDVAQPNASTKNSYVIKTLSYKDLPELKFNLKLSNFSVTPPWVVVDAKALKAASLREKLKGWTLEKLKASVFNYKAKKNGTYKDIAELSALLENMLFMNNSLASEYYAWILKLGL